MTVFVDHITENAWDLPEMMIHNRQSEYHREQQGRRPQRRPCCFLVDAYDQLRR